MARYSIKELEQLSGIKAHTIRIWEKRYGLIKPCRTDTNIRYYSDADLKKIINVALLNSNGYKISKIVEMQDTEISKKILEISAVKNDNSIHVSELVSAMVNLDEERFESTLSGFFLRYNFEQTITEIVYPFLEKTGVLWQTDSISPAQEHFISNLIRQKIIVGIDGLPLPADGLKKVILFLPEHELHEIALLFYHYLLRKAGYRTFYLGQAVPHQNLQEIFRLHQPDILITSLTTMSPRIATEDYLKQLSQDFPCSAILVTGLQVRSLKDRWADERIKIFRNIADLKRLIAI